MTQIAVSRQPLPAAIAFIASEMATQATFSVRGRSARLPCSARAIPSAAKMTAPTSGTPASRAAITGACLTWLTITYWASQLTTAAAAASTARAAIALRNHARPVFGWPVAACGVVPLPKAAPAVSPVGCHSRSGMVAIGLPLRNARLRGGHQCAEFPQAGQCRVQGVVEDPADPRPLQHRGGAQPAIHVRPQPGGDLAVRHALPPRHLCGILALARLI